MKQLDSRFKAFGSPLGFAYGLENQADQLGFVSDYAPSDRQEDAWRVHYTADMFDQVLSAAERNEFLYTHPVADTACYNVFRWTPSADAQKKDITLCGTLFSNLGNGVQLRVIRWNDDTRSEILGTYNTSNLTTGKYGTAGFVLRLKPGEVGKHLDFVLHNAGDYASDASALKIQALTKVRQPTQTSVQTDVTDKVQAKFRKRLVTPLGRYAELFGAGTPGAQNTLKVKLKDPRDGKVKYLEFPQDAALDLTENPTP